MVGNPAIFKEYRDKTMLCRGPENCRHVRCFAANKAAKILAQAIMNLRLHMLLLIFLFFALVPAHAVAAGKVGGAILFGSGQYRAEVEGNEVQKVASEYGQVSLGYRNKGEFARLGQYTLMLGYEFNMLNPTYIENGIKDRTVERIEKGKVLYQGEVLIAPGGLPFRLSAYARDINQSSFSSTGARLPDLPIGLQGGRQSQAQTTLLSPDIMTNIENGTHHEIGATLLIGIRNGSYSGVYRNTLSQIPRILVDYKQVDVRDLAHDSNQRYYRERDLAFISLNKKDNWVHYRTHDYVDYLDPLQNFLTRQVMIGTIDHRLSRQWINLTNWIKISGDLSYTVDKQKNDTFGKNVYRVNMFATTQRPELKTTVLSSFERTTHGERMTQDFTLPVYFNYEPNRNSFYRGRLHASSNRQSDLEGLSPASNQWEKNRRDFTFDLGSEFFRTRAIVFSPRINLGFNETDNTQVGQEKLTLEWSNNKANNSLPWTAGGYLASTQSSTGHESSVYMEQSLYGNVEKNLKRSMRVGLRALVRHGDGQRDNEVSTDVLDRVEIGETNNGFTNAEISQFLLYDASVFWEHVGTLFSNRFEVLNAGIKTDSDNVTSTQVQHELRMTGQRSKFLLSSSLSHGSEVRVRTINTGYLSEETTQDGEGFGWSSKAEYNYVPDRCLRLTVLGGINGLSGEGRSYDAWLGSERMEYSFYKSNGILRKIADISEEFRVEGTNDKFAVRKKIYSLNVAAAVYPNKYLYVKAAGDFILYGPSGSEQMEFNTEAGANFQKLQVALSYGRAYKAEEGLLAEVMEERWDVKVRKTF